MTIVAAGAATAGMTTIAADLIMAAARLRVAAGGADAGGNLTGLATALGVPGYAIRGP